MQVHPSGKFVYGSNRGHNSIAVFTVDPKTGELTAGGHQGEHQDARATSASTRPGISWSSPTRTATASSSSASTPGRAS